MALLLTGPSWTMAQSAEELENRLIGFAVSACQIARWLPKDVVGSHVARQMVRSATSPAANYAEARSAESRRDFIHKVQICLKEIRETGVWLQVAARLKSIDRASAAFRECHELTSIFVATINTARRKAD